MNHMNLFKNYSFSAMVKRFGQSFKRFPVAMLFVIFLTGYLMYINHKGDLKVSSLDISFFLVFYPATGAVLAVALSLLTEDFKNKTVGFITQVVVHSIWFFVSLYLSRFDRFSMPQMIAVSATVVAMNLAVFLICFYRRHQDVPFWNFSIRTVIGLIAAITIGGILTLGLFALLESLKLLFDMHIRDSSYGDIAAVCMVFLTPSLFMNLIPGGENKYVSETPEFSGFAKGVVQYLFLPLLGLYMITLYAYGAMILVNWSLPVGGVSYLVTGSMVLMVLLIYITYPVQHQEGNKMFKLVTRWLPVVMLPLLALMTVAIVRRLSDYGITVSRLYLLVFNLWCYAVCLWLIFTRNKRIWLIPASFAAILLLISVGPQSIANVTHRQLLKEARNAFNAANIRQFPLTGEQYEQWLKSADPKIAKSIDSKLHYLYTDYGFTAISELMAKDVITGRYSSLDEEGNVISDTQDTYSNYDMLKNVAVPCYNRMTFVRCDDNNILKKEGNKMWLKVNDGNQVEHQFILDIKQLTECDADRNSDTDVQPLMLDNGESVLLINDFYITVNSKGSDYLNLSGILFTK
ncbi:MAG: DUF4153 domain-containing protein [Muribaculaceae bacterium]|nr:DUF4153 domain-containing protein [Muribaculaceae bacterium]